MGLIITFWLEGAHALIHFVAWNAKASGPIREAEEVNT